MTLLQKGSTNGKKAKINNIAINRSFIYPQNKGTLLTLRDVLKITKPF